METNFDYLLKKEEYADFAKQAVEAEKSLSISPATCAILSRRALELAVRFVFSYDAELSLPYRDNVSSLIHEPTFRRIIEPRLFPMLKYTIHLGNVAVHTNNNIGRDEAIIALRDLFEFCDWIDYSYSREYDEKTYDESILASGNEKRIKADELMKLYESLSSKDKKLESVLKENEELREQMAKKRSQNVKTREFHVDTISEAETRKRYIDVALKEAGWVIGRNVTEEELVTGMPNSTGTGYVDYVLWGKDNLPLAVVEAKKASVDAMVGSQQAKLYADCLQNKYNRRPLIFITNGFEFFYTNDYMGYPRREVSGFFTQEELQLEMDGRTSRIPLENIRISDDITNRPYQKEAVTAVCDAITNKHRKMLIVQATGSGKTRVSISIVDVLRRHNYVKNILFLADRKALVKQAKNNYTNLLPDLSCCNLLDNKDDPESCRMIFSTYPTMMNAIDERKNKYGEKLFSPGHFQLIICDEVHRSIYSIKYSDSLIDEFSTSDKMPQIAVSVDMLDTGIDIPEILTLVFFKKVKSYAKFWQMIGRGTRLCPNLLGEGMDKERFLIFDFCNNFEYFRVNKNGAENGITESLNEKIYNTKAQIVRELQAPVYSSDEVYADYRKSLVDDLKEDVISLNDDSFMVKRHLRYVEFFRASSSWDNLETIEISDIREHIAPLIRPKKEDELARRFDYLVYSIDLGLLQSKSIQSPVNIVVQTAEKLSAKYSIPQVEKKKEIIEKVQTNEFWDKVTIIELDTVREALRGLLQYLDRQVRPIYYTNFTDSITDGTPGEPLYGGNDLKNYRKKVEFYLKEHSDKLSVYKLKNNKKLTETDLRELERILWTELGSKEDYIKEYGETPIGRLVRKIVGVDRAAVNEAFSCFMSEERLNINQMRFVNLIVDYIVANGNIEDNKVLMGEPFKSVGSITTLFKDDMSTAKQIMEIVNQIKRNSEEIA